MNRTRVDLERGNAAYDVLSHHHRRFVLVYLADDRPPVTLSELAGALAEGEHGVVDPNALDSRQRIAVALHHHHLPRLDDAGLLTYRAGDATVADWVDLDLSSGEGPRPSVEAVLVALNST